MIFGVPLGRRTIRQEDEALKKKGIKMILCCSLLAAFFLTGCGKEKETDLTESLSVEENVKGEKEQKKEQNKEQNKEEGDFAPDFSVELNDGSIYTLSDSRGRVVLINIWATWCGPCCREMPAFQRLYEEFGDELQIVAVNYAESKKSVDQFVENEGYTFPFAYDEDAVVSALYPSDGIPYTVIIDTKGKVYQTFLGAGSADEQYQVYKKAIEEALSEAE